MVKRLHKIKWLYFLAGKREQMATVTSVEVPNSESHSGAEKKRNSSEGSIEAYPYANEDTNETIEGKILNSTYCKNNKNYSFGLAIHFRLKTQL